MAKFSLLFGAVGHGYGLMEKNSDGLWTFTTPVLPSEMYTYRVIIDGVIGLDPLNPFTCRDVGTVFSIFYVNGGCADYYQVHDVPHGSLTQEWYHSETLGDVDRRLRFSLRSGSRGGGHSSAVNRRHFGINLQEFHLEHKHRIRRNHRRHARFAIGKMIKLAQLLGERIDSVDITEDKSDCIK